MANKSKKHEYQVSYFGSIHGGVAVLPNAVLSSPRYIKLSWAAKALLTYIAGQYNHHNNGDLCATVSMLEKYGFKSRDTLTRSLKQLENNGLIYKTRVGGKDWAKGTNLPTLYAITWQPIDECKGKLEVDPTTKPLVNFIGEMKNIA